MSVDLKTLTPDTTIADSAVLFGADSQASTTPSVYSVATLRTHIVGTANTFTQPQVVSVNSSSDALRITQTGTTGNALVVEDSANPDASPFVVDTNGRVLAGATTSYTGVFGNAGNVQISSTSLHGIQNGRFANDAFGSDIQILKSRSTTIGAQGIVQNGDALGSVLFSGSDGTAFLAGATITAAVDGVPGQTAGTFTIGLSYRILSIGTTDFTLIGAASNTVGVTFTATGAGTGTGTAILTTGDMPGRLVFNTTADGAAFTQERMRITSAGRVGIGTTAPNVNLEVATSIRAAGGGGSYAQLSGGNVDGANIQLNRAGSATQNAFLGQFQGSLYLKNLDSGFIAFTTTTSDTERMRITSTGNVCIGTTAAGTSAEEVLAIGTGVAPTTGPADTIQIYSTDLSAGNTILSVYTEGAGATNAGITNTTVTNKIAVRINGTVYYLLATTNGT